MISVKEAAKVACSYLLDLYSDSPPQGVRLEEVELTPERDHWLITLSYVDTDMPLGKALAGLVREPRTYKTVKVDGESGEVVSMKIRQLA